MDGGKRMASNWEVILTPFLTDGDHNIDCKIEGFGAMGLKSEFVRKA